MGTESVVDEVTVELRTLFAAYDKLPSPERLAAYRQGLKQMPIPALKRVVEHCCGERQPKDLPKPGGLWEIYRSFRARAAPHSVSAAPPRDEKWLGLVNSLFLKYLLRRRISEGFQGDINLPERRKACISLASFFQNLEAERDPDANEPQLQVRFERAMQRLADVA